MAAPSSIASARATATPVVFVFGPEPASAELVAALRVPCVRHGANVPDLAATRIIVLADPNPAVAGRTLDSLAALARRQRPESICLVTGFGVHCGDSQLADIEASYVRRLRPLTDRLVIFRPGHMLGERFLRRLAPVLRVLPDNLTSCFLDAEELAEAIQTELGQPAGRPQRTITLLGANRPWCELAPPPRTAFGRGLVAVTRALLSLLLIGPLGAWLLDVLSRRLPTLATLNVSMLQPTSMRELLALYNPYNYRHVKIVGYNNGVVHFGHRYPGRTLVSTLGTVRLARVRGEHAQFDAGVTIRRAMDVLAAQGKELHVLPNYSYVTLGTAFFVPIHGSASKYCTVAETIESVILYDPVDDRVIAAKVEEADFGHYLYNLSADVLLLRLELRVKDRSRYQVKQEAVANPTAQQVWDWFHDSAASNVEVRKAGSKSPTVHVYRYYPDAGATLDIPRDRLGRLWDRLEENRLTSFLFHTLSRKLSHHVELFLSEDEFRAFWETHGSQPIAKIQLRFIRRDGFAHSPFRDHDCISADLFMLKKHRPAFEAYLKQTLPGVKMNPGKHSGGELSTCREVA